MKLKSIQSKVLLVTISAMLIIGLALSLMSVIYINQLIAVDSDIITESVANTEALRINDSLDEIEDAARMMENYVLSTLESVELLSQESYLSEYTDEAKKTLFAVTENTTKIVAYYLRFAPEVTNNTKAGFFVSSVAGGKEFLEIEPTDLADWQTAPWESVCWYSEPVAAGKPVWLLPYHNPNNDVNMISYVIPIYIEHTFIGVAGIDMEFKTLTSMIDGISVYDNGFAYLCSTEGEIFYSAVDEHVLDNASTDHGYAEEHRAIDNGMMLVIHADYSDIQRDSYRMITMMIFIAAFIIAGFIFITIFMTKRIVYPLKQLAEAAEMMADGNAVLNLDKCNTGDEVELLAQSMQKTSDKLHGYMSYINALAYQDSLTGIKNSTAYKETAVNIDIKIRSKESIKFAVLVADINKLKFTNDMYGHETGNRLIVKVAKLISGVFKHSSVFRLGGDEFVIIVENEDYDNCDELILKLDQMCAESFIEVPGGKIDVSVARGLELYNPEIDTSFDTVFSRADKKMYENKNSSR